MANRTMFFEENDDGTTTVTAKIGDREFVFLLPFTLDTFKEMIPNGFENEAVVNIQASMIQIPNEPLEEN